MTKQDKIATAIGIGLNGVVAAILLVATTGFIA